MNVSVIVRRLLPLLFLTACFQVQAAERVSMEAGPRTELRASVGQLNGMSGEYVYDAYGAVSGIPGYKVSELQWELNEVLMAGLGLSFSVNEWLRINADYQTNAGDGDGTMDDYDWLVVGYPWTHWSHHENTTVREASQIDANAEFTLYRARRSTTRLYALAGYREDHFDWQSRGGYGIYSVHTFRDTYLLFPDTPGISYKQTFTTPYVGLGLHAENVSQGVLITLDASVKYSAWVEGEDEDIHHLRDLKFIEKGDGGSWLAGGISLAFHMDKHYAFHVDYFYQTYDEIKATTTLHDLSSGTKTFISGDAAGLDHQSSLLSIGMSYKF